MDVRDKLYKVTLKGMTNVTSGVNYGISYVIAVNSDEAYRKVRDFLDKHEYGFTRDRELFCVELIADSYQFNHVGHMLFI